MSHVTTHHMSHHAWCHMWCVMYISSWKSGKKQGVVLPPAPCHASLTYQEPSWVQAKIIIFSRTHCHFEGFTSAVPSHTCVHVGHPGQLLSVPYRNPWQCGQLNYYIIFPKMISRQSTTGEIYPDFGARVYRQWRDVGRIRCQHLYDNMTNRLVKIMYR